MAVAALVSTALAQAEAQADLATMSAIGASPRFRRWLAGSQAVLIALTGTVLGVLLGLGPGAVLAIALTGDSAGVDGLPALGPIVAVPWEGLPVVGIGVPLLAAAVAALGVRRTPGLTRRST